MIRNIRIVLNLIIGCGIISFIIYLSLISQREIDPIIIVDRYEKTKDENYKKTCIDLYKKIRTVNKSLLFNPPLRKPPSEMLDEFTMNGQMPITKWFYINGLPSADEQNKSSRIFNIEDINKIRTKIRSNEPLIYDDKILNEIMHKFALIFANKSMAVIGTIDPWIESIGIELGANHIATLEYSRAIYQDKRMKWYHVNDYLDDSIKKKNIEEFDVAVSFSSLEHAGLGRYGDPLNPNGDIEAVKQIHCMLKPGGIFFLGLPTSTFGSGYIHFNAHRIYGQERLDLLFKGWKLLYKKRDSKKLHTIFVLKKC